VSDRFPPRDPVAARAAATPDRTLLLDATTGDAWTARELDAVVAETAAALRDAGVDAGQHVGVLMDTRVEFALLLHATLRLGATLVPLNARLTPAELGPQVRRADVSLLVCERETAADAVAAVADGEPAVPVRSVDAPTEDGVVGLHDDGPTAPDIETDAFADTALIQFTSGTTGRPKAVALTAGNLLASATASAFRLGVAPDDRWLVPLPMYHMGGLAPVLRTALYGTTAVLADGFDAERTRATMAEYEVTTVSLVPTALSRLLDAGDPPDSLRTVLLGGAPASADLLDRARATGVPTYPTYGMTETASQIATARPAETERHPGTVGQPLLGTTVTVVDDDGDPLGPGEVGEIVVDGPTVTPGYYGDPEATAAAVSEHGLHTGDAGEVDADGRLWVHNRLDDRIVTGGENVDPGEVIDALRTHEAVADAAVVGVADEEWGERVAALVVPEGSAPSVATLEAHCDARLAGYKRPRIWGFADELPRTASGTVDREAVRDRLRGE